MAKEKKFDIAVIGAGSGGLSVAAGAALLGRPTLLVERGEMGGDCLNSGCVPSKALLAAAGVAAQARAADAFGIHTAPEVDFPRVRAHLRGVIEEIAPIDSQPRFEGLGVTVMRETARFIGPDRLQVGDEVIRARRIVIATGSRPAVAPIPGLDKVPVLTNETIFNLTERPAHLIIIGGGPIGVEMAQAHRRLGSAVTLLERETILARDDPEAVDILRARLQRAGIALKEGTDILRVDAKGDAEITVSLKHPDGARTITGSHLLVAAGRQPVIEDLDLYAAGIETDSKGIITDAGLKTTNPKVYAIGDCAGGPQFTHVAGYHAGLVIRNALFRLPARVDYSALPRVTYTDPELASIGLSEAEARAKLAGKRGEKLRILRAAFADNDRAVAERATDGHIKVVADAKGRVLGVTIIGKQAGEMLPLWGLMIKQRLKLTALTDQIIAYPTRAEIAKRAASAFYTPKLFSDATRKLVRLLSLFG